MPDLTDDDIQQFAAKLGGRESPLTDEERRKAKRAFAQAVLSAHTAMPGATYVLAPGGVPFAVAHDAQLASAPVIRAPSMAPRTAQITGVTARQAPVTVLAAAPATERRTNEDAGPVAADSTERRVNLTEDPRNELGQRLVPYSYETWR